MIERTTADELTEILKSPLGRDTFNVLSDKPQSRHQLAAAIAASRRKNAPERDWSKRTEKPPGISSTGLTVTLGTFVSLGLVELQRVESNGEVMREEYKLNEAGVKMKSGNL